MYLIAIAVFWVVLPVIRTEPDISEEYCPSSGLKSKTRKKPGEAA
jgi:hypothetical protein